MEQSDLLLDADRLPKLFAGAPRRRAPRRECRRTVRVGRAPARPRAERHRHSQRARGHATRRGATTAVLLHWFGVRRMQSCADARGRSVSGADVALRCLEGRGRGLYRCVRGSRPAPGDGLPLRVGARSALLPRSRDRFRPPAPRRPRPPADPRRRNAAQELHARVGLCGRGGRPNRRDDALRGVQPRRRRLLHGHGVGRVDLRARSASNREFEYTGGDRGWIGDNPFIYLDTERTVPPAGRPASPSARPSRAPSTTSWPNRGSSTPRRDECGKGDPLP